MIATSPPVAIDLPWSGARPRRQSRHAAELAQGLARELHDGVAQSLTTMLITMEHFKREQAGRRSVIDQVSTLQQETRDVLSNIRQLLHELRGEPDQTGDFVDSLRQGPIRRLDQDPRISVQLVISDSWPRRLRSQAAHHLYRIVQEALNNVRLHSGASAVTVTLEAAEADGPVSVEVRDDGRGIGEHGGAVASGMGLLGIRERVAILGGDVQLESEPGKGTTLRVSVPAEACA